MDSDTRRFLLPRSGIRELRGQRFCRLRRRHQEEFGRGELTWTSVRPPSPGNVSVTALAALGNALFSGVSSFSPLPALAKTIDGGKTWIPSGPTGPTVSALFPVGSALLAGLQAGGVIRTDDAGATWADSSAGLPDRAYVYAFATSGSSVLVGTDSGVYKSDDAGHSWSPRRTGYARSAVRFLAAAGDILFAQTPETLERSSDGGATWQDAGIGHVYKLTSVGDLVFAAATGDYATAQLAGSTDGGLHWSVSDLPFVPNGLALWQGVLFASTANGVFSTPDGSHWESALGNLPFPYATGLLGRGGALLVELAYGQYYRSTDGGVTWDPSVIPGDPSAGRYLPNQNAQDAAYVAGGDGLFQSIDGGATWQRVGDAAPGYVSSLTVLNGEVFAVCQHVSGSPTGLYHMGAFALQRDGSWAQVSRGLLSFDVSGLAVAGGSLFAGVEEGGVQKFQSGRFVLPVSPALPIVPAPINVRHRAGPNP